MKIYVVKVFGQVDNGDYWFSSREDAETYIADLKRCDSDFQFDSEYEIIEILPHPARFVYTDDTRVRCS